MADIRINALATTAASTASDDFVAVDGSANGTRKLNAFSPTFGGNLTVSGTATLGPTNPFKFDTNVMQSTASGFNGALVRSAVSTVGNPTFSNVDDTDTGIYFPAANTLAITTGGTQRLSVDATATTLAGNLTVSGTGGFGNTVSITKAGGAILELNDSNQTARIRTVQTGVTHDLAFHVESAEKMRLFSNGNLFVGASPVDGGQKLQVSGDAAISDVVTFTGGGVSAYTNSTARIYNQAFVGLTLNGSNLQFRTGLSGTTALTLDSSQNATFAGTGRFNGAAAGAVLNLKETAGVPTALNLTNRNSTQTWSVAVDGTSVDDKLLAFIESGSVRWSLAATTGDATFGGTVKVKNQATLNANAMVNVGTSATSIFSALNTSSANWAFVFGDNGTSGFADLVVTVGNGNAVAVISSATIYGSPPARTYTSSSTNLQLAMASGTMSVRTSSLNNGT